MHGKSGSGIGVKGTSASAPGVRGESSNGPGVYGISDNQPGIDGTSNNSLGIRGTSTNFVGILGLSTNGHGLYGSTTGANAFGIVAENKGTGPGLLVTGDAQIVGALQVFGTKNAVIKMADGTNAAVYCQESPEPYFEDFGRGQLAGGVANVPLEREFAQLVAGNDYMVFCFPQGDTRGLFVSRQTPAGFEVREIQGGVGNVPFTYRIVTRRKDVNGKRFARVNTDAANQVASARAALTARPGSFGTPPTTPAPGPVISPPASLPAPGSSVPGPGLTVRNP